MEDIEIEEQPKAKAKRQLTQAQLDQLAKAREKANAVRKQNAEMKKKEKRLKELQRQVQEEEIDEEIERYSAPDKVKATPKAKPKKLKPKKAKAAPKKKPVEPVESEDSSDEDYVQDEESSSSEEEEEEEPTPPPKPSRSRQQKKTGGKVRLKVPKKKHSKAQHYQPVMEDVYAHQMNRAFGSLFPNYNV